jgi:hypothetical protein
MDYFAGLDISMDETHVCVVDREGVVVHQSKTASTPAAIAVELVKAPSCRLIVFETGRMAPILFPRAEPTRPSRGLRRKPAGLPGAQVARHPQGHRHVAMRRARVDDATAIFKRPRRPRATHSSPRCVARGAIELT